MQNMNRPTVCQTTPLCMLPGYSKNELAYCPFPVGSANDLLETFQSAPQFSHIPTQTLLAEENLRVLLLGTDSYYLRQAAVYLSAIHARKNEITETDQDHFWDTLGFNEYITEENHPTTPTDLIEKNLTVVSPILLDKELAAKAQSARESFPTTETGKLEILRMDQLDTPAILIAADSGTVLTDAVLQQIEATLEKNASIDLFIALQPNQMDKDLLEELRFTHYFRECQIGSTDQSYLRHVLEKSADDLFLSLDAKADLDEAILHLRRYRGSRFTEADLHNLLVHAAIKNPNRPLKTADLLFAPITANQTENGMEQLNHMIGLDSVKNTLRRLLATSIMEDKRFLHGIESVTSCRNLAFSGPPGTGKSVTARLVAQIMRERGCGSGRFVEAGREQLIGAYLGQTSPMIARLFQQAKGGVLFIDEAGALLNDSRQDSYATEAVNALVRHMELEPETIVIFATYPEEMQQLLTSNAGLSSRIAQVIHFETYSNEELYQIFHRFAQKEQMAVSRDAKAVCIDFFQELKQKKGENFGNGREARRLYQTAKEELALRTLDSNETTWKLTKKDLQTAADRLLGQETETEVNQIGFAVQ